MTFASRIPPKTLAMVSRSLATMLESGIQIRKAIGIASKKAMHAPTKKVLRQVSDAIQEGSDLSEALKQHGKFFPTLFLEMVTMAEESGSLPEVLKHLAEHYEANIRMRKEFIGSIIWPAFQLIAAIFVIALLILILGFIAESTGNNDMSFLVFGLSGATADEHVRVLRCWLCCLASDSEGGPGQGDRRSTAADRSGARTLHEVVRHLQILLVLLPDSADGNAGHSESARKPQSNRQRSVHCSDAFYHVGRDGRLQPDGKSCPEPALHRRVPGNGVRRRRIRHGPRSPASPESAVRRRSPASAEDADSGDQRGGLAVCRWLYHLLRIPLHALVRWSDQQGP